MTIRKLLIVGVLLSTFSSLFSQPVLTEVSQSVGISHHAVMGDDDMPGQGGAAWFDHDNDGWYDLYLTGGSGPDAFYRNNGDGTFTDRTIEAGFSIIQQVNTDGVTTGDYNRDGWNDLFVTTFRTAPNYLFLNNGDGTFTHQANWEGATDTANSFSASFCDLNMDGWLDLFVCNWSRFMDVTNDGGNLTVDSEANFYYENNGNGSFTEQAAQLGIDDTLGCALGVMVTDFDDDNRPDLFVANDFGFFFGNSPNRMFRNEHPQSEFAEVSSSVGLDVGMNGMGVTRADINSDGLMDYYITNILNDRLMVSSISGYEDELVDRGLHNDSVWVQGLTARHWKVGWGAAFLDIDNDMDEDLIVANGSLSYEFPYPSLDSNKLFLNDGNGHFSDVSFATGVADTYVSRALAYCDYDRDGDLDVFIGITDSINGTSMSFLYRNDSPPQNWLQVKATGVQNNLNGIGTKVKVFVNGQMLIREIGGESSYSSQHWQVAHFGLGPHQTVDSVDVIWPGGTLDRYYNVSTGQFLEVLEGQGGVTGQSVGRDRMLEVFPNPFAEKLHVSGEMVRQIELFDAKGALVLTVVPSLREQSIDTAHLPPGSYLLRVELTDGQLVSKKLMKE